MKSYEDIPYGPLTRENFRTLASSFFDASRLDEQEVAKARGINRYDYMRDRFAEVDEKHTEQLGMSALKGTDTIATAIVPQVVDAGDNPDGSSWTSYSDGETLLTDPDGIQFYME